MVTGSPGGNSIPAYVAKTIVGVVDWEMSAQEAVDHPNIIARGESVRVEVNIEPGQSIADDLKNRGYTVQERDGENSGLHIIVVTPDGLDGSTDGSRAANAITPGRRPRSSMSPSMIFDAEGELLMVTGSPGGNSIPAYVAKTIVGVVDWGMDDRLRPGCSD